MTIRGSVRSLCQLHAAATGLTKKTRVDSPTNGHCMEGADNIGRIRVPVAGVCKCVWAGPEITRNPHTSPLRRRTLRPLPTSIVDNSTDREKSTTRAVELTFANLNNSDAFLRQFATRSVA